eukprot:scaffold3.g6235.t1
MEERAGEARAPLSPLHKNRPPPAVAGSTTKDRRWQRKGGATVGRSRFHPGGTNGDSSESRSRKKLEGSPLPAARPEAAAARHGEEQQQAGGGTRIPLGPRMQQPSSVGQQQPATASRIPRPSFTAARTQQDLLPAPAPPDKSRADSTPQLFGAGTGFQTYDNPSFDAPGERRAHAAAARPAAGSDAGCSALTLADGVAELAAPDREATQPSGLPADGLPCDGQHNQAGQPCLTPVASSAATPAMAMPTPEAWKLLQHLNQDSPAPGQEGTKGVQGIMNAYLRTGPQMLSPEPGGAAPAVIPVPGVAAVPAQGLMALAGRGGVGVYGMVNAFLRTGAQMLSPEPGLEADGAGIAVPQPQPVGAAGRPVQRPAPAHLAHLSQLYSPASPLRDTPQPALAPAAPYGRPGAITPSSVCSNAESSSSSAAAASISLGSRQPVPSLPLGTLAQSTARLTWAWQADHARGTQASLAPVSPGSFGSDEENEENELPTARLSPVGAQAQQGNTPPSPISFCLPGDSPPVPAPAGPPVEKDTGSPSFSFGIGPAPAPEQPEHAPPAEAAAEDDVAAAVAEESQPCGSPRQMHRIQSGETVQGPNPFQAMLRHLNGPAYASPAPAALPQCDSPQSPQQLTPLHLISEGHDSPAVPAVTLELGVGSLTAWVQRRGVRTALDTPVRNDLRQLWVAAGQRSHALRKVEAVTEENAALAAELETLQGQMEQLGLQHDQALAAANAGALCAESEVARAQEAARQMMQLAEQIQRTFALCEEEKAALVQELQEAQQHLAESEASATSAEISEQKAAEVQAQLEAARQAVAAAEQAAAEAQARAESASAELAAVRGQLEQAVAATEQQVPTMAAEQPAPLPAEQHVPTSLGAQSAPLVASLRSQLGAVQETLQRMVDEQVQWRGGSTPGVQSLLDRSMRQLELVGELMRQGQGEEQGVFAANTALRQQIERARSALAAHSPASAVGSRGSGPAGLFGSPVPFSLRREASAGSEGGSTPATVSDVFASPYLTSCTTLTVDYRNFSGLADTAASRSPARSEARGSAASSLGDAGGSPGESSPGEQQACTVVHNGMVITNVPVSEVTRVRSLVQYWEAMASGEDPAAHVPSAADSQVVADVQADAEAFATAAVEAAMAAVAAHEATAAAAAAASGASPASTAADAPSPLPTPASPLALALPEGERADTPLRTTPLHFAAAGEAPPLAPACTPASQSRAAKVTPLALSVLRRRSNGEAQDEVRGRLQRLKADLQAAQAKLLTVDKGLAAIAFTPSSVSTSIAGGTPSSSAASRRPVRQFSPVPAAATRASQGQAAAGLPPQWLRDQQLRYRQGGQPRLLPRLPPAGGRVGSSRRTPQAAASAVRMAAVMQSVNKPAAGAPVRRFRLEDSDSEGAGSSSDEDLFNDSRMAVGGARAPALSPAHVASSLTPVAMRPAGPPPSPGTAGLSATSFSPPEPLALLAVKPLGRLRRCALGGRGRRPSATEEREFRRRAAALQIQISPYWKRGGGA